MKETVSIGIRKTMIFAMAVLFWLSPKIAFADEIIPGEETFLFQLGYFLPSFDTKLKVGNQNGVGGDNVNLEDELGYDHSESTFWGSGTWRMSPRNRLSLGYFRFHRGADRVIQKEITIGDKTYPVGAELNSSIVLEVIPIGYSFSFIKNESWDFSGTFGIQWSTITFDVNGSATVGGGGGSGSAHADANALAPLPLLGLALTYYINPKWSVGGNVGVFSYKLGASNMDFQGDIATATVGGDWWFADYFGVGAAVNWFSFNVDVEAKRWKGSFNYQYWGPQIYLTARF